DAAGDAGRLLRQEGAAPALALGQVGGDVAELRREVLVDEQDVHRSLRSQRTKDEGQSTKRNKDGSTAGLVLCPLYFLLCPLRAQGGRSAHAAASAGARARHHPGNRRGAGDARRPLPAADPRDARVWWALAQLCEPARPPAEAAACYRQ